MSVKTVLTLFVGLAAASVPFYRYEHVKNNDQYIIKTVKAICHEGNNGNKCVPEDYKHCTDKFRDELQTQCKAMRGVIKQKRDDEESVFGGLLGTKILDSHDSPYHKIVKLRCCEELEAIKAEEQMKTLETTLNAVDIFQKDAKEQLKELLDPNIGVTPIERVATVAKRLQTGITKLRSGIKLTKSFTDEAKKALKGHEFLQGGAQEVETLLTGADKALKPVQLVMTAVKNSAQTLDVVNRKDIQGALDQAVDAAGDVVSAAEDLPDFFGGVFDKLGDKAKAYLKIKAGV
ncbi:hypothetical protein HIM_12464 [Hirsutella minnesotensis 3608]|uniref:Uncharacterized protein n=1 Tax=Hirsutella minnesotensis 3608 TaxID=1043627 RepID=A0A0F8A030_9HYPO|nr:hypothetical protein HIM_12464 [Hirsutella minnesotensis 3608]